MTINKLKFSSKFILLGILLIAAGFRFYNFNWDQGQHLHPDERFLIMVGNAMKMPESLSQYLDPRTSLFNPANIGYKFFVYGTFPIILNKILAIRIGADNYNDFAILGRQLSAVADLLTIIVIFNIALLLKRNYRLSETIAYFAAFFYAITVFAIQQSHFFTVDTFLNLFMTTSFYFSLKFYFNNQAKNIILSSFFFALAIASKISAIQILPLLLFFLCLRIIKEPTDTVKIFIKKIPKFFFNSSSIIKLLSICLTFFLCTYIVLRFADPHYFKDQNFFNLQLSPLFIENIKTLQAYNTVENASPPSVQWLHKTPVFFSLYNLAFFGLGLPYFVFMVIGIFILIKKYRNIEIMAVLAWFFLFFFYQSTQFVKVMRYFTALYPLIALLAAVGLEYISRNFTRKWKGVIFLILILWPLSYLSIYIHENTRISATKWIYQNIPQGSTILSEHWDDALPLRMENINYNNQLLPVFDPDNTEKWNKMNDLLQIGDYLILSSNRGWGSIPTVPEKYPLMTKFYKDLFTGKLQYEKIKEFTSYPSLTYMGIPFTLPDDWADESFTVYDHPRVTIFKNISR